MLNSYKYTLSLHYYGFKNTNNHLDLFIDVDGTSELISYKTLNLNIISLNKGFQVYLNQSHRRLYLNYSGYISNNRGKIRILKKGYILPEKIFNSNDLKKQFMVYFAEDNKTLVFKLCGKKQK